MTTKDILLTISLVGVSLLLFASIIANVILGMSYVECDNALWEEKRAHYNSMQKHLRNLEKWERTKKLLERKSE